LSAGSMLVKARQPGQPAHAAADDHILGGSEEFLEMRHLAMRLERRRIGIDLVERDFRRIIRLLRYVELQAARLFRHRGLRIGENQRYESGNALGLHLKLGDKDEMGHRVTLLLGET